MDCLSLPGPQATPSKASTRLDELIIEQLPGAIADNGLSLVFQPQFHLCGGQLAGLETLMRWHHPEHGSLPPLKFITLAEQHHLIASLEHWLLHEVCRQLQHWNRTGVEIPRIAVNISTQTLKQPEFALELIGIVEQYQVAPTQLQLEITESAELQKPQLHRQKLEMLRASGFSIALDDFGTGYSSLSYLNELPIDCLKIDRSFLKCIQHGCTHAPILETIINLGHALGLQVIAEGIETQAQDGFLREHHCDVVQGYFYAPPLPAEQLLERLRESARAQSGQSPEYFAMAFPPPLPTRR